MENNIRKSIFEEIKCSDILDIFNNTYYEVYAITGKLKESFSLVVEKVALFKFEEDAEEYVGNHSEPNVIYHIQKVKCSKNTDGK